MASDHDGDERSWTEYRRLILNELERIDRGMTTLNVKMDNATSTRDADITALRVEIAMLKVKASMWGGASGTAVAAVASFLFKYGGAH